MKFWFERWKERRGIPDGAEGLRDKRDSIAVIGLDVHAVLPDGRTLKFERPFPEIRVWPGDTIRFDWKFDGLQPVMTLGKTFHE